MLRDIFGLTIPFHRQTAIPGKLAGVLLVTRNITDCYTLLHTPAGCAYHRKVLAFNPSVIVDRVFCTNLTESDAVLGGEQKLTESLIELWRRYRPGMIVVATGCTPDIIGDDVGRCVEEARDSGVECPIAVVTEVRGMPSPAGSNATLIAMIRDVVDKNVDKIEKSVNLFALPIHESRPNFRELELIVREAGAVVNRTYLHNNTTDDIRVMGKAELMVVDYELLWTLAAREELKMEVLPLQRFSIGSVSNLFELSRYGINGTLRLLIEIGRNLGLEGEFESVAKRSLSEIGDQVEKLRAKATSLNVALPVQVLMHDAAWSAVEDLGLRCSLLIAWTRGLGGLSEEDLKRLNELSVKTIAEVQGQEPELLENPSVEEVIRKVKEHRIDAVICGYRDNPVHYLRHGVNAIYMPLVNFRFGPGFYTALNTYRKLLRLIERGATEPSLMSLVEYNDDFRVDLPTYWSKMCRYFNDVYHVRE